MVSPPTSDSPAGMHSPLAQTSPPALTCAVSNPTSSHCAPEYGSSTAVTSLCPSTPSSPLSVVDSLRTLIAGLGSPQASFPGALPMSSVAFSPTIPTSSYSPSEHGSCSAEVRRSLLCYFVCGTCGSM